MEAEHVRSSFLAHAAQGIPKGDNPARHPAVAEVLKGWRNQAPAPKQADALTTDALTRIRETARRDASQPAGNSPVYGPGWESPLVVAQGVAGKPGLFLPGRTVCFCPFQPGVQQCHGGEVHRLRSRVRENEVCKRRS